MGIWGLSFQNMSFWEETFKPSLNLGMSVSLFLLQPGSVWRFMACVTAEGCAAIWSRVDVTGPWCHQGHIDTGGLCCHGNVQVSYCNPGPCLHLWPCCSWRLCSPSVFTICSVTGNRVEAPDPCAGRLCEQGDCFCCDVDDFICRDMEGFCDLSQTLQPPPTIKM